MTTSFEYAPCAQRASYNDIKVSVVWTLSNQLKYVSIVDPGNFNIIMSKKTSYCTMGDGQHIDCDTDPLLESFAVYLENTIHDKDHASMDTLLQRIDGSATLCWDVKNFVKTLSAIIRETLFTRVEEIKLEPEFAESEITPTTITITIDKNTAIICMIATMLALAALAAMQLM